MPQFSDDNPILRSMRRSRPTFPGLDDGPQFSTQPDPSLLGQIGSAAVSGLSAVGNLLDVPGSMARDILAWENPVDQLLSPFSEQNRTTGRDLNRKFGLAGHQDTYANWFGGFATEIATDPLTYLTLGGSAVGKAGQVAKKAGYLQDAARSLGGRASGPLSARLQGTLGDLIGSGGPEVRAALSEAAGGPGELAQLINEPLGTLARLEIPFTGIGRNIGSGPAALRAAQGIDRVSGWLGKTAPARVLKSMFDPSVMGEVSETGQTAAREVYRAQKTARGKSMAALAAVVHPLRTIREGFEQSFGADIRTQTLNKTGLMTMPDVPKTVLENAVGDIFDRFLGFVRETKGDVDRAMHEFNLPAAKMTPDLSRGMRQLAVDMRKVARDSYLMNRMKGGKGGILEELADTGAAPGIGHVERFARGRGDAVGRIARAFQTQPGHTLSRTEEISNVPKEIVERMLADDGARNVDLAKSALHIRQRYGEYLGRGSKLDPTTGTQVPKWNSADEHAEKLATWVAGHKPEPLFEVNNLRTFDRYMRGSSLAGATYDAVHTLIERNMLDRAGNADLTRPIGQFMDEPLVFLEDAYRSAGMDPKSSLDWLSHLTGKGVDDLKGLAVPLEISQAINAARKLQSDPQWFGVVGELVDSANRVFKQAVTLPFPSFWARNLTSGQFMNMVSGLIENFGDASSYGSALQEAAGMIRGGIDQKLERELLSHGVFDQRAAFEGVELPTAFDNLGRVQPENPLNVPQTWQQAGASVAQNPSMIDRVPGGQAARQGYQALLGTGSKASQQVEFMNRVPMYLYLTRHKGWSPAAAAQKIRELQIDYTDLAPFEKQVMRRLIPFYSFQRKIAPVILQTLAERPGGAMAQTIRGANRSSDSDASTPDYVRETLSIPNPYKQPTDGTQSYLTGFGLPFEQLFQYAGSPREVGREALSQLTPLAKAPLEWSTNQSFFQRGPSGAGRPLDDLDPTIGRTISNLTGQQQPFPTNRGLEFLAANSPASRFLTSARQATDPRKSPLDRILNAFTGVRVTDVSPAAQDAVLRDRAIEMMKGMDAAEFSRVYFRAEDKAAMSPEERAMAVRLEQLQSQLAQRAKDRKLKKAGNP